MARTQRQTKVVVAICGGCEGKGWVVCPDCNGGERSPLCMCEDGMFWCDECDEHGIHEYEVRSERDLLIGFALTASQVRRFLAGKIPISAIS